MIDLRVKGLPNTVKVGGRPFRIKTDFRIWIEFDYLINHHEKIKAEDLFFVFEKEVPDGEFFSQLIEFYSNPNSTPNNVGQGGGERILDYVEDGEYIYSSFLQCYNIDLTEVDLHWHKFKALLSGISDNSKISKIMSYRGYTKTSDNTEKQLERLKAIWRLPDILTEEDEALLEWYNSL